MEIIEDIIFENYPLFSKYKHINQAILDKLSEKIKNTNKLVNI